MSEMKTPQRHRSNPLKPSVRKLYGNGMWWAEVMDANGQYLCHSYFTHADALEKARQYAAMNKEAAK
jgi:hypothetical protein